MSDETPFVIKLVGLKLSDIEFNEDGEGVVISPGTPTVGPTPPPTEPLDPPFDGTFKALTGYQFGEHPMGTNFPIPGVEPTGTKFFNIVKDGQSLITEKNQWVGDNTSRGVAGAVGKYEVYVGPAKFTFFSPEPQDVSFNFVNLGSAYGFSCYLS